MKETKKRVRKSSGLATKRTWAKIKAKRLSGSILERAREIAAGKDAGAARATEAVKEANKVAKRRRAANGLVDVPSTRALNRALKIKDDTARRKKLASIFVDTKAQKRIRAAELAALDNERAPAVASSTEVANGEAPPPPKLTPRQQVKAHQERIDYLLRERADASDENHQLVRQICGYRAAQARAIRSVDRVTVLCISLVRGAGTERDRQRIVTQYWLDDRLLVEHDPLQGGVVTQEQASSSQTSSPSYGITVDFTGKGSALAVSKEDP